MTKHYKSDIDLNSIKGLLKFFVCISILSIIKSFNNCFMDF